MTRFLPARLDPLPHLPLSPSPQGRRGNASNPGRVSLSAPGGGEGRGEVGVFSFTLHARPLLEDAG